MEANDVFVLTQRIWQRCTDEAIWWRAKGLLKYAQEAEQYARSLDAWAEVAQALHTIGAAHEVRAWH